MDAGTKIGTLHAGCSRNKVFALVDTTTISAVSEQTVDSALDSQRYYDSLAAEYRAQDSFWDNPYDREIWRLENKLVEPHFAAGGRLLDVGCGFYPHFKFTSAGTVIAGDISFASLVVARQFGDESRRVSFVQFDASALPFATSSFEYAIAGGELLNHIPDYARAVSEIRRVLKPGGHLLLQVGAKWCFDTLWAVLDSCFGQHVGYAMTRDEAKAFLRFKGGDLPVTWNITPGGNFRIRLLSIRKLRRILRKENFQVRQIYGANVISGLVPLPVQQECKSPWVKRVVSGLIRLDRFFGRIPILRSFGGNIFFVCEAVRRIS